MKREIKYTLAMITAALLAGGLLLTIRGRPSQADEKQEKTEARDKQKTEGVRLDPETQERIGLQVKPLQSATVRPEVTVYGTLEADPSEEFILRSPFTGILMSNGQWPAVGVRLDQGTEVGSVRPLFAPMDRVALNERLASARAEWEAAKASEASVSKEVNRLKQLNSEEQNASDKAVQEAEAQLASEKAKLHSAQASVELITAHEFVRAIKEDRLPSVNVWEAVAFTLPGIVAHQSALRDGELLKIKDYGKAPA
jgi:hypothetical protein